MTEETQVLQAFTGGIVATSSLSSILSSLVSQGAPNRMFESINQLQLLMLLPLLGVYLPIKVIDYIKSLFSSLISFGLEYEDIKGVDNLYSYLHHPQPNEMLDYLGFESGSTLVNVDDTVVVFFSILALHLIISLCYLMVRTKKNDKLYIRMIKYIFESFNFGVHIRFILEAFLILLLCSLSELQAPTFNTTPALTSCIFAITILIVLCITTGFVVYKWVKSTHHRNLSNQTRFKELYSGVKDSFWARSYSSLFLLRRTVLCLIIIRKYP